MRVTPVPHWRTVMPLFFVCALALAAGPFAHAGPADFETPVDVVIEGYDDDAMEPFISRDGEWLFFNNRNQPADQTDIHIARAVDETRFRYVGPLAGANSDKLEGVPSMDRAGWFYFVSPREYGRSRNTLWRGRFADGTLIDAEPLRGDAPRRKPLWLNIDAEISAEGRTLYFVESRWRLFGGGVKSADMLLARRDASGAFMRPENAADVFAVVNSDKLDFAPALTADELTLYFTRADPGALREGRSDGFGIFVATRSSKQDPFGAPKRIAVINGYVEAPSVAPDECGIYFHKRNEDRFEIEFAQKSDCARR